MDKRMQSRVQDLDNAMDMLGFYAERCEEIEEGRLRASAENCLASAINAAMDIGEWILRSESGSEEATHKATVLRLADCGVLGRDFAQKLSRETGFWDLVLYKRSRLDAKDTHDYLKNNLDDFRKFADELKDHLKGR